MELVSLKLLKMHMRADDFSVSDELLQKYLEHAEEWLVGKTNRTIEELLEMGSGKLPGPLQQAVMNIVAHWHNFPEGVAGVQLREVPYTISAMVKPYTKLV